MRTARMSLLIFGGIFLPDATGMADEGAILRAAFAKAAQFDGDAYVVARQVLESQGESIVPLLTEKAKSSDWREWSLAKALLIRMQEPQQAVRWRWAIRNWQQRLQPDAQGRLVTSLSEDIVKAAALVGETLAPGEVELGKESLPIIIDSLRETASSSGQNEHVLVQSLIALKYFKDPKAAGPILTYYPASDEVIDTLAAFGAGALPELHTALKAANAPWPKPLRASLAAKVLGRIGNDASARLLTELLPRIRDNVRRAEVCQAIGPLKSPEGPEVLFHELQRLAFDRNDNRGHLERDAYLTIRSALLDYGVAAEPAMKHYTKPGVAIEIRAMAEGILYELSHPKDLKPLYRQAAEHWNLRQGEGDGETSPEELATWGELLLWTRFYSDTHFPPLALLEKIPAPLLIEIAAVTREEPLIERLSLLTKNELAIEALKWLLFLDRPNWAARRAAILPLAEIAGAKAIPSLREFIEEHPLNELDRVVEAAIVIGEPKAGELLEVLLDHPESKRRSAAELREKEATIRSIAQVLKQEPTELSKLLELEDPALRFTAARVLAKNGDVRSVGLLFTTILDAANTETESASLWNAHEAQRAIVKIGKPALAAIEKAAQASNAKFASLLAEVLTLRINNPKLDQTVQDAMNRRWPGWGSRRGPSLKDMQFAGQQVAKLVGEPAVPLLEAMIVWPEDVSPTVAAFALAEFQKDRSLEIVLTYAGRIRWGGATLEAFGEKGIAAAKTVPIPNPDRARFEMRRGRHREATTALTIAKDAQGIEGILAGLQLAAEGKIPAEKTNAYLRLAAAIEEERLIPAIAAAAVEQEASIADAALRAAQAYDDERLVPMHLKFLGESFSTGDLALQGLARILGENTPSFVLKQLEETRDDDLRRGLLQALPKLRPNSHLFEGMKLTKDDLQKQVASIREALIKQLNAKDSAIQVQAAESLALFIKGQKDKPAIEALATWMAQQDMWPPVVVEYIVSSEEPSIAPAILVLYRKAPLERAMLAKYFAAIQYEPALDDVASALENRIKQKETFWTFPEIEILARYGKSGREKLWELLNGPHALDIRVAVLQVLCQSGDERAFEPTAQMLEQLVRNGLWNPELVPRAHRKRSDIYFEFVNSLTEVLAGMDSRRAYPLLVRACLTANEPDVQNQLGWRIRRLLESHPEYRQVKVDLDRAMPMPMEDRAEVPLLKACDIWHELITQHHGQMSADVRERLIARGEDGLQVGVELFYDWPVPTRQEIAKALADLTHEDPFRRREATALLAGRKYPAELLDQALADANGNTGAIGNAIRNWRQKGGRILDADLNERGEFTTLLLTEWPIDQLRQFTIRNLDRLAQIPNEAYNWGQKPLFPMLLSVRYSPKEADRILLRTFTKSASPEARPVSSQVELEGVGGFYGTSVDRWGTLPPLP